MMVEARAAAEEGTAVEGPTLEQMSEWQQLYERARAVPMQQRLRVERVPTGKTRAAYARSTQRRMMATPGSAVTCACRWNARESTTRR